MAARAFGWPQRRQTVSHRFVLLCLLILLVGVTGGSSRPDAVQLLVLRPASVLLLGYALWSWRLNTLANVRVPLVLLVLLATLIVIQLIPLPPMVWQRLPGRDVAVQTANLVGLGDHWYPLSLAPGRSWNTLMSLPLPIATLIIMGSLSRRERRLSVLPLLALGMVSLLIGIVQRLGPPGGQMYFYAISSYGAATGLFANRNHEAMLLAALLPTTVFSALRIVPQPAAKLIIALVGVLILLMGVVLTTSRGGFILLAISALITFFVTNGEIARLYAQVTGRDVRRSTVILAAILIALLASLPIIIFRAEVLTRLSELSMQEGRLNGLPIYWKMVQDSFPAGIGFGAFERVYQINEPFGTLGPSYLNHARNDLVEWMIEGGAASALILAAFMLWFVYAGVIQFGKGYRSSDSTALAGWLCGAVLLLGSLIDYPIRTPIGMVVMAIAAAWLAAGSRRRAQRYRRTKNLALRTND